MQYIKFFSRALMLLPFLEILGFIVAGAVFGIIPTLMAFFITTLLGIFILRNFQWVAIARMQQQLREGYIPADMIAADGFLILAGFLLVIPGFITDIIGLLCLIPAIRQGVFKKILEAGWLKPKSGPETTQEPRIIEGEAKRVDVEEK